MADKTPIEWTDATWSPLRVQVKPHAARIAREKGYTSLIQIAEKMAGRIGPHCEHCSDGCDNCYAETNNHRCLPNNGTGLPFDRRSRELVDVFVDEKILEQPLRWKRGRRIFVENQSDLFGEWVTDDMIDRVFAVMALCPQHTFQVLTKRSKRMLNYLCDPKCTLRREEINERAKQITQAQMGNYLPAWPLRNVWLGVSCEDQQRADERIPDLLVTPAAVRFISAEPLLGRVNLQQSFLAHKRNTGGSYTSDFSPHIGLDWVIVGGESGRGARPMHPDWASSLRDQCASARVPLFFKQWGRYVPVTVDDRHGKTPNGSRNIWVLPNGQTVSAKAVENFTKKNSFEYAWSMCPMGKKAAGNLLDGRQWLEFPEVRA